MPSLERRIRAFATLGDIMTEGAAGASDGYAARFTWLIENSFSHNAWFTPGNVKKAVEAVGKSLSLENILKWLSRYPDIKKVTAPQTVGVIMAGNIPLVGFHDMLCVLITGNRLLVKPSSKDEDLIKAVAEVLTETEPSFSEFITFSPGTISGFEMVIATGSNNSSRYFDYYFRNYPSVIRRNRNSVAVIDGTESDEELRLLGEDVFSYFGLGCRNVTKLYLPEGYDIARVTSLWQHYETLRNHQKYASNYDHNKAVMIVNRKPFIDTGYVLLCNEPSLTPPMAVLHFDFYSDEKRLEDDLNARRNDIQCISGHAHIPFGKAQYPDLWEYADDIDLIMFLLKKNTLI